MRLENEIRVILADDHAVVRQSIRRILEKSSNILVVGEASTGADAVHLVQELQPDVLLLDMEMPDMNGYHVTRALRAGKVRVSILMVSACDDHHFITRMLEAGVDRYLHKSEAPAKIREAVYQISGKYGKHAQDPWFRDQTHVSPDELNFS